MILKQIINFTKINKSNATFFLLVAFFVFLYSANINIINVSAAPAPSACPPLGPLGGLVPCGRLIDNPDTIWNETEQCKLCHVIPLINGIITYVLGLVGLVTLLFVIVASILSYTSFSGAENLANAKKATLKTLQGFVIVLVAWAIINLIMALFGFIDPMGDGSWKKFNCDLNTDHPFCGDGKIDGGEVCEPGDVRSCTTTYSSGLPAYCSSISIPGTQTCNSCCSGWGECIGSYEPTLVADNYGKCDLATTLLNGYSCCELTGCHNDGCCGGENSGDASLPGGYTQQGILPNVDVNKGNCKLGQSGTSWAVSINHTTAGYRCWK